MTVNVSRIEKFQGGKMKMKDADYYIAKRDKNLARIKAIDRMLKRYKQNKAVKWNPSPERLEKERNALAEDVLGYNAIIASLESGIRLARYHNYRQAFAILNREYQADRRANK
jgi:hypothetical protein